MRMSKITSLKSMVCAAALAAVVAGGAEARETADPAPAVDPLKLYGEEIHFDVYREGSKVGFHRVQFERDGDVVSVGSTFELKINILFFTAFEFLYQSEAIWRDGHMESLSVAVDDDGDEKAVSVARDGDRMAVENATERFAVSGALYPTNHWNPGVLGQTRVLNTLTGRINNVDIVPQGRELVETERGKQPAMKFAYTGDLQTEVWYDDAGRWVKMRFKGKDGSTIEYKCKRCQGTDVSTAEK